MAYKRKYKIQFNDPIEFKRSGNIGAVNSELRHSLFNNNSINMTNDGTQQQQPQQITTVVAAPSSSSLTVHNQNNTSTLNSPHRNSTTNNNSPSLYSHHQNQQQQMLNNNSFYQTLPNNNNNNITTTFSASNPTANTQASHYNFMNDANNFHIQNQNHINYAQINQQIQSNFLSTFC
jgi:hypothetical protein